MTSYEKRRKASYKSLSEHISDSDSDILDFSMESSSSSGIRVIPYELKRSLTSGVWQSIKVGSLDWKQTLDMYPESIVVRVSAIVNEGEPESIISKFGKSFEQFRGLETAQHVVCMFKEFSVSENSPVRFAANFWFIFSKMGAGTPKEFNDSVERMLPERRVSYITIETLHSFLTRRELESKQISVQDCKNVLRELVDKCMPCSSLFLKLSSQCPEYCRDLLGKLPIGAAEYLVGVRAIHKLAVSCTSMKQTSLQNFESTINVMKQGIASENWSFVVFKTLTRLATKNDRLMKVNPFETPEKSQIMEMLSLVDASRLDLVEKLAIRLISKDYDCPSSTITQTQEMVDFLYRVIISKHDSISDSDFGRLSILLGDGSSGTCHLSGVLLEKCVEQEKFLIGWKIASTIMAVNEHTIEEAVTLCSKAFFKMSRKDEEDGRLWYRRLIWCVNRHYKLLGKYPTGLALHVAAHQGDFELCWQWFQLKKDEKSFKFTAHHTSAILKAATYTDNKQGHMLHVLQAYRMTPPREKSAFIFEPLMHLWNKTEMIRDQFLEFWSKVYSDLCQFLDGYKAKSDSSSARKNQKLRAWSNELKTWKNEIASFSFQTPMKQSRSLSSASKPMYPVKKNHPSTPGRRHSTAERGIDSDVINPRNTVLEDKLPMLPSVPLPFPQKDFVQHIAAHRPHQNSSMQTMDSFDDTLTSFSSMDDIRSRRESSVSMRHRTSSVGIGLPGIWSKASEEDIESKWDEAENPHQHVRTHLDRR